MKRRIHRLLFPEYESERENFRGAIAAKERENEFLRMMAAKIETRLVEIEKKIVSVALQQHVRATGYSRNWPAHLRALGVRDETLEVEKESAPKVG